MEQDTLHTCQHLANQAKQPFDLKTGLKPERVEKMTLQAPGWKLLYGTERLDESALERLASLAVEANAISRMREMQRGEKVNKFESRPALHTAVRDLFGDPKNPECSHLAQAEIEKLKKFVLSDKHTDLVLIAIGGSELGPEAFYLALQPHLQKGKRVHFISNIDPDNLAEVFEGLNLSSTLVLIVSKSGTTQETATNEAFARDLYKQKGIESKEHFIAVTMPGTPMDSKERYKEVFHLWDWVGGRYSVSSMGGGVLLAWAFGIDVYMEILKGAHDMDEHALEENPQANLPLMLALIGIWNRNFLKHPTLAIIPYSYALRRFPAHLQQVDMESNGKHVNLDLQPTHTQTGPIIWGEPGTSAQHSFFQLIHQGTDVIPVEFIGFLESERGEDFKFEGSTSQEKLLANLFAQAIALAVGKTSDNPNKAFEGNRSSHILFAKKLTPYTLGALLALYEHKVAFQGFIWDINSFDQEGVQLGKVLATKMLDCFSGEKYPLGEAFLKEVQSL